MASIKHVVVEATQTDGFTIESKARKHTVIIDQPEAGGGKDCGPNPLEYLFFSLAGCVITIGHIIVRQRQLPVRNISARVEGDLDTEVLMGKSTSVRAGFTGLKVFVTVDGDMTQAEKEAFIREVDARCPISDNIHNLTPIEFVVDGTPAG